MSNVIGRMLLVPSFGHVPLKLQRIEETILRLIKKSFAPIHKFSKTFATIDIKSWHTQGCPVFLSSTVVLKEGEILNGAIQLE